MTLSDHMSPTPYRRPTMVSDLLHDGWDRLVSVQPDPGPWVVVATAVGAGMLVATPAAWSVSRHVLTLVHEGAHGVAALLTGRRLAGIRLHSDTSGLTVSHGRPTGAGMVVTAVAGYVGPALVGLGAAWLLSTGRAVAVLWALLALLALLLVQIRNWFGLWSVLVSTAVVLAASWWLAAEARSAFAYLVTWFLLLAAPRPVLELRVARRRRRSRDSDADQLARLTHLPAALWMLLFLAVTVVALLLGVVLLLPGSLLGRAG